MRHSTPKLALVPNILQPIVDKAAYIGIRDILKWKMDHKNSKNVDPSSIIITSFHFHLVKWRLGATSIRFINRFGMHIIGRAILTRKWTTKRLNYGSLFFCRLSIKARTNIHVLCMYWKHVSTDILKTKVALIKIRRHSGSFDLSLLIPFSYVRGFQVVQL